MEVPHTIRPAVAADQPRVAAAVTALLRELSGNPERELVHAPKVFAQLIAEDAPGGPAGGVLVCELDGELAGVVTYSFAVALRTGGEHCVIQELWVAPAHRGAGIGGVLLAAVTAAVRQRVNRIEVGLPGAAFAHTPDTQRFYAANGFQTIGDRAFLVL